LLPHQLTDMYAYVMDHAGGRVGLSLAAVLFTAGLWWFVNRIFVRDTSAGLIWRIGARPPDPADLKEQQLVHVAEELAIAAATPPPAVWLFDGPNINAAVIGDRPEGAGLLVSREMLNTLDRDETQGVIAHLLASEVNGDLHLTGAMLRVFYMMGIAVTLLDLPLSPSARKAIALLWRYSRQSDGESAGTLEEEVGAALTRNLHPDGLEALTIFLRKMIGEETDLRSILGALLLLPLLPLIIVRLAAAVIYGLTSLFILGPLAALVMRSRRRLADATAVQLTRNPDGLARALIHLYALPHVSSPAGWSEMNFIIGHEAANARQFDRFQAWVADATMTADNFNRRLRDPKQAVASLAATPQPESAVATHNFVFGFHPPLGMRIIQLKKMGADVAWAQRDDYSSWIIAAVVAVVAGGVLLLALA
jgi:Zn-dependent protease with chaperone function